MAESKASLFHLEEVERLAKREDLTQNEAYVLNVYETAMQYAATQEIADEAAQYIDSACPPLDQIEDAETYLWNVWQTTITIARSPDVTSDVHERLLEIMRSLNLCAKGELLTAVGTTTRVWKDMPQFPICLDAFLDDPTAPERDDFTPNLAQMWRNVSSFAAKCLAAGLASPYDALMRAMRGALEEEQEQERPGVSDWRMLVACEWIAHAARPLLSWAQENVGITDAAVEDDIDRLYCEGGALYQGPQTMCLRRWGFWLDRFEELGKQQEGSVLSESTRKAALEAAETMRRVESANSHTWSG